MCYRKVTAIMPSNSREPLRIAAEIDERLQSRLVKKTTSDLRLYFPTIILRGSIGLVSATLLSKLFAPEAYGNYVLAFAAYSHLTLMTGMWLSYAILRLTPEYKKKDLYHVFVLTLIKSEIVILSSATGIGLIALWLTRHAFDPQLVSLFVVAVLAGFFLPLVSAIEEYYRITDHVSKYCAVVLSRILCGLACGLFLALYLNLGVLGYFIGLTLPYIFIVVVVAWAKRKKIVHLLRHHSFSAPILKDAVSLSVPLVLISAMTTVLGLADRYLINWYLSAYEVALYGFSYIIASQAMELITLVLVTTADPIAMRNWEEHGEIATTQYLKKISRYYSTLTIPALVGLIVLGKQIIELFSTQAYIVGFPVLAYVGLGVLINGYCQLLNRIFMLHKRTRIPFVNYSTVTVMNILLNLLLIPKFGYIAAAWTTLASYVMLFLLTYLSCRRLVSMDIWGTYLFKVLAASMIMGTAVHLCHEMSPSIIVNLFGSVIIGVCLYTLLLYFFGIIKKHEIQAGFEKIKHRA